MGAFNRAGSEMTVGTGITTGGLSAEAAKTLEDLPPIDIMLIDWIFWTPDYVLHTGGVIAIVGMMVVFHGWNRGRVEKNKREKRDNER
jgi:hypothetical protein